jgi:transcriptional antiterminator Rof (Rho-off)
MGKDRVVLTFEQIAEEAKAYANITCDQLETMDLSVLHEQLSLRLVALEEVIASKKAFTGSANDLLKRIRGDILCLNQEIRGRVQAGRDKAHEESHDIDVIDALPEPACAAAGY